MNGHFQWNGAMVSFVKGESLSQALSRAGILNFGTGAMGQSRSVFCGIGQCQNCLVVVDDTDPREACLTLCRDGMVISSVGGAHGRP